MRRIWLGVGLLALAFLVATVARAQSASVALKLDAAQAKPGEELSGTVTVSIPQGFHANQNPPSEEGFLPVVVSVASGGELVSARYPKGVMKKFGFSDSPLAVYEGAVRIPVRIRLPESAQGEWKIKVNVQVQMCDDLSCYPPQTISAEQTIAVLAAEPRKTDEPPAQPKPNDTQQQQPPSPPSDADRREPSPPPVGMDTQDSTEPPFDMEDGAAPGNDPSLEAEAQASTPSNAATVASRADEVPLDQQNVSREDRGFWALLLAGFVAGLLLNLTPCVYPLIPITLSFFSNQAKESTGGKIALGISYMLGIALSFGIFGAVSVLVGKGFGTMFQSPYFNLALFALLFALALSMFGLYEIRLPQFLQKQLRGRSGTVGAFIMGSLLGVGAAPCGTALIAALAVVVAEKQSFPLGISVFTAIGLGIGLPYVFLAVAGAQLPKSADWLVTLKRIMGLMIILFAVTRYLGPALQGLGGGVPYVATLWINTVAFLASAVYLLWFDRSFSSTLVALIRTFSIVFMIWYGAGYAYDALSPAPEGIQWEKFTVESFEEALKSGQPVVVDGTANWCAACMEIEHKTFTDPDVIRAMKGVRAFKMDLSTGVSPEYQEMTQKYFGWKSLPHIRFYDRQGRLTHIQSEFIGPEGWLNELRKAGAIP
jgi:thiol:disulfide interchange protein DsbD